jgi:UPF0755 protein
MKESYGGRRQRMAGGRRSTTRSRTKKGKKRGGFGRVIAWLLILALLAGAGTAAYVWFVPYGPAQETFVEIAPHSSALEIGGKLEQAGVIRSQYVFDALRWLKPGRLVAGTYRFAGPARPSTVYRRIQHGDVYTISVTIPEGANLFDIAARLEEARLGPAADFLAAAKTETSLIEDLDPQATSLEGYLFPDTYHFGPKQKPAQIAAMMVKRFRAAAAQLGLRENVRDVVTMASLIERETAMDSERPLVASVFENRLAKGMPLMTDPAVIYGLQLEGIWRGTIYASDLKRDTPYNTYLHAGLPPGPVANPGMKSLRAAMEPAQTNYLYFVAAGANPQGESLFSATLKEHIRNVSGYRGAMKKAGGR